MAMQDHVRTPLEWAWDHLKQTGHAVEATAQTMEGAWEDHDAVPARIQRIGAADIGEALATGFRDFGACRTDVIFLCLIYPIAGLIISRMAFDYGMVALIFPLFAGFALIAPLFSNNTFDFTPRLVRALNYPKLVLPTHWDNFEAPLTGTPTDLRAIYGDPANLDLWVKEMKKVTPRTKIVTMPYFGSFAP